MANPNTIPWLHYEDIQIPDISLRNQFKQYMQNGQYDQALLLLNNNNMQLKGKAYIADTINKIISGVMKLQDYYNSGVTLYLSELAMQYNILIQNFKKIGEWQSALQYNKYNFIFYNNDIYMCLKDTTPGILPTNSEFWLYLGIRGEVGAPGIDVHMSYGWSQNTIYQPNDLVVYNHNIYCAKETNNNVIPTDTNTWTLFIASEEGKINVGTLPPSKLSNNIIWFQTDTDPNLAINNDPISGVFKKYNKSSNLWEDMYPNVLFKQINGIEPYSAIKKTNSIIIYPNDWQNNSWTYFNSYITSNSIVEIWPNSLTESQYKLYNNLILNVNIGNITLTSLFNPNVELPIIITIQ